MGLRELLIIGAMLVLNALFAAFEIALASTKPERLKGLEERRFKGAHAAVAMRSRMEASLAVVQLGITFVGAIAAATGGANADETIAPWIKETFHTSNSVAEALALGLVIVPLAAVTIVAGELIPKSLAIRYSDRICLLLSPPMRLFARVVYPLVWVLEWLTKAFLALVEKRLPQSSLSLGEAGLGELRAQVSLLRAGKIIGRQEERIILRASRLSTRTVGDIMLPAADIVSLDADAPLTRNFVKAHLDLHTRFPVTTLSGDPQGIIGYVTFKEMTLLAKTHPHNPSLREILRPLIDLPLRTAVSAAMERMIADHVHLALVRDEREQVVGMVTMEDVLEQLVGDIEDEFDRLPRQIVPSGRGWLVGGGATLARLRHLTGRPAIGQAMSPETTVDDWLHAGREGRLRGGDAFRIDGLFISVRKIRRQHVSEAVIEPVPEAPTEADAL